MSGHPFAVIEPPMTRALFTSGGGRNKPSADDFADNGAIRPLVLETDQHSERRRVASASIGVS
jgi:hypothetical protein